MILLSGSLAGKRVSASWPTCVVAANTDRRALLDRLWHNSALALPPALRYHRGNDDAPAVLFRYLRRSPPLSRYGILLARGGDIDRRNEASDTEPQKGLSEPAVGAPLREKFC